MSVKIELLDYQFDKGSSIVDLQGQTSTSGTYSYIGVGANNTFNYAIFSRGTSVVEEFGTFVNPNIQVVQGKRYEVKIKVTGYTGNSDLIGIDSEGVQTGGAVVTIIPTANQFMFNGNSGGTFTAEFTAQNTGKLRLKAEVGVNFAYISGLRIYELNVVDFSESVAGVLDVSDHSEFPLAVSFQISDIQDITSSSGAFSKTFKVPATKNNNNLLKHVYIPKTVTDNIVTDFKPCRIMINDLYSLEGRLQVNGIGGFGETASYYECIFYGNNLSWATVLGERKLKDLDWGADLLYNKSAIETTWNQTDSTTTTSNVVYPIVSYGDYNPDGENRTIQLLSTRYEHDNVSSSQVGYYGFDNGGTEYGTPQPCSDWRPCIWVKDTLEKIFAQTDLGYTLDSNFVQGDIFKKLMWSLPNFKYYNAGQRLKELSFKTRFKTNTSPAVHGTMERFSQTVTSTTAIATYTFDIDINDDGCVDLDGNVDNTGYDATTGQITIQEYGYHNIELNNFSVYVARKNSFTSTTYVNIYNMPVELAVKTVGHTTFTTFASSDFTGATLPNGSTSPSINGGGGANQNSSNNGFHRIRNTGTSALQEGRFNYEDITVRRWFNKGDVIEIRVKPKLYFLYGGGSGARGLDFSLFGSDTANSLTTGSGNPNGVFSIELDSDIVEYGQQFALKDVINPEFTQIDFLKGITHAFNLKMTTDEKTKIVSIEPFNTFYKNYSDALDWTYKVDRSMEIKDDWLKSNLKKNIVFKYKTDPQDKKVERRGQAFFDNVLDEYPYIEELDGQFEIGTATFENPFFAGTYSTPDKDASTQAYGGFLSTENVSPFDYARPAKGYDFLPRLLYWNKFAPAVVDGSGVAATTVENQIAKVQTWDSLVQKLVANSNFSFVPSGNVVLAALIPQGTSVDRFKTATPNLLYGNVWVGERDNFDGTQAANVAQSGLYQTYWEDMINMVKQKSRIRTLYIQLNVSDITLIDFRKLIYIDGCYWRLNKVIDYQPHRNQPTKVELIEWYDIEQPYIKPPQTQV